MFNKNLIKIDEELRFNLYLDCIFERGKISRYTRTYIFAIYLQEIISRYFLYELRY